MSPFRITVTIKGRRFVLVAEHELRRLERLARRGDDARLSALPPADSGGNLPSVAYIRIPIAESIRQQRRSLGLSQKKLARLAHVGHGTICRLECGVHSPNARTAERVAQALHKARSQAKRG